MRYFPLFNKNASLTKFKNITINIISSKILYFAVIGFLFFSHPAIYAQTEWTNNGSDIYYNEGGVGIGAISPSALLEIQQDEDPTTKRGLLIKQKNSNQRIYLHLSDNFRGVYGFLQLGNETKLRGNGQPSYFKGDLGVGTTTPNALLEIRQEDDPNTNRGLLISEKNNSQKIFMFIADNSHGEYGFLQLGNETKLRGNGQPSHFKGHVGIGTTQTDAPLTVNGRIHAEEVKVDLSVPAPDYVFDSGYKLNTLDDLQSYIDKNGHLPNIPSAAEMEENGVDLGTMEMKLLEKIEELTLYIIQQQKEIEMLKKSEKRISKLEHVYESQQ